MLPVIIPEKAAPLKPFLALLALTSLATVVQAEQITCTLAEPCAGRLPCPMQKLEFFIDHNQFVDAVDAKEPPRNKVTVVSFEGTEFAAEPLILGVTRGFWEDNAAIGQRLFTMQGDGTAIYSETATGRDLRGTCVVMR